MAKRRCPCIFIAQHADGIITALLLNCRSDNQQTINASINIPLAKDGTIVEEPSTFIEGFDFKGLCC